MPLQNTGTKTNKLKEYVNMDNQAENIQPFVCIMGDSMFKTVVSVKSHITTKLKDQMKDVEPD